MTDLLPCPMCGTPAHFFKIDDVDQKDFGGQGICCQTEGCVQIGLMFACMDDPKPMLAEKWNSRCPQLSADVSVRAAYQDWHRENFFGKIAEPKYIDVWQAACAWQEARATAEQSDDDIAEAREILTGLMTNIETDGPYSTEATCTFIRQALLCLNKSK